jgi:uncharacterized surface protein with fasciclin (FAS1) repeats
MKLAAALTIGAIVSACGGSDDHDDEPTQTLAEIAVAGNYTALVAAATKAELVTALGAAASTFTVFAPTDAAFAKLATDLGFADANALVTALPKEALTSILQYHLLPTAKSAADLQAGGASQATAYQFESAAATLALATSGGVTITDAALRDAKVTKANVRATNGIIHEIDRVLVPPGVLNVVQMAQSNPDAFSTLVGAVGSANLVTTLSGTGPFTVFAPVNPAFAAIASTVSSLTPAQLSTVLTYHVLGSQVLAADIPFGAAVPTVAGQSIRITAGTAPVIATIADTTSATAEIKATNVRASNGVIHVIDKVLIPNLGS